MADELNGQALPVRHKNPYKNYNFQNDGTSRYFSLTLKIGALTKLGHSLVFVYTTALWPMEQSSLWLFTILATAHDRETGLLQNVARAKPLE